jgi:hypothetical protein
MLLGRDPALQRQVVIWLRPPSVSPLGPARRGVSRATRLRWLAGGRRGDLQWDAFLAPSSYPLAELLKTRGPLSWSQARPILEQIAEELAPACAEGALPDSLTVDQVWIYPNGDIQLLDFPFRLDPALPVEPEWQEPGPDGPGPRSAGDEILDVVPADEGGPAPRIEAGEEEDAILDVVPNEGPDRQADDRRRALAFLRQLAAFTLERSRRPAEAPPVPIRVPLPEHAARILSRLLRVRQPQLQPGLIGDDTSQLFQKAVKIGKTCYTKPGELRDDLAATRDLPAEVTPLRRALHLLVLAFVLYVGCGGFLVPFAVGCLGWAAPPPAESARAALLALLVGTNLLPALFVLVALLEQGWTLTAAGMKLVGVTGTRPSGLRCAWRVLLVWAPVCALLSLSLCVGYASPRLTVLSFGLWCLAILALLGQIVLAICLPRRSLHDYLAGTCLMPK